MRLKIKFMPYERVKKENFSGLLKEVRDDTIILVDAKLTSSEEAVLIQETMKNIGHGFSGIELSSIEFTPHHPSAAMDRIKEIMVEALTGKKRGMTVIGPAKIIHRIKRNPEEVLLYM